MKFLSYIGIAMIVFILLLLCCCFCKKCNCWKRWIDDDFCGRICLRQTVINQRDVKSSNEDLRERIQIFDQQNRSPSLQSFPASTSLEMTTVDSSRQKMQKQGCIRLVGVGGKALPFSFLA
jgi:hypothetical protein